MHLLLVGITHSNSDLHLSRPWVMEPEDVAIYIANLDLAEICGPLLALSYSTDFLAQKFRTLKCFTA